MRNIERHREGEKERERFGLFANIKLGQRGSLFPSIARKKTFFGMDTWCRLDSGSNQVLDKSGVNDKLLI